MCWDRSAVARRCACLSFFLMNNILINKHITELQRIPWPSYKCFNISIMTNRHFMLEIKLTLENVYNILAVSLQLNVVFYRIIGFDFLVAI